MGAKIRKSYDYVIVGSGFGGSMAARNLIEKGKTVLLIDRGVWPLRDDSCWDENALHLEGHLYRSKTPFLVDQKKGKVEEMWPDDTVGGMSTLYGAVSFRMRKEDFAGAPLPNSSQRDESTAWPYGYKELKPYYKSAEKILGIAGIKGKDITEPPIAGKYLHEPSTVLSRPSEKIWNAAEKMGLHPFFLPMAINYSGKHGKEKCILCSTCDHYLCKIEAKNDLTVMVLPQLVEKGLHILPGTRVLNINFTRKRATSLDFIDQSTGEKSQVRAKKIIIAGGALSSPHLLLTSRVDQLTGNKNIGHYLMRHVNGVVAGVFTRKANPENILQKQIGIPDFYHGGPEGSEASPPGPWGMIQDVSSIGKGVIKANAPLGLKNIAALASDFLINLLCIGEDTPSYENRVFIDEKSKDSAGMSYLRVYHRYNERDLAARDALYREARKILKKAGAFFFYNMPIETFSHGLGTCRMGRSIENSVVDGNCKVWGTDNLYVMDGSVMPAGGSVNPSLTIAALALKASEELE